jgi:flavin reductase (DIM6/NTAB) family NADH-FMN oxidoreductase RutF
LGEAGDAGGVSLGSINMPVVPSAPEPALELDPEHCAPGDIYRLHSSLIVPRPIAWVSTVARNGVPNLAPHSYYNAVCDDPPMVMFAIEGEKDTYHNVVDTGEFVVNIVSVADAEAMELTAVAFSPEEDEAAWASLPILPARRVRPGRMARSRASLECTVDRIVDLGRRNHMIIGKVVHYFVDGAVLRDGRVDPQELAPLGRLGGAYAELGTIFKLSRPAVEAVRAAGQSRALGLVKRSHPPPRRRPGD